LALIFALRLFCPSQRNTKLKRRNKLTVLYNHLMETQFSMFLLNPSIILPSFRQMAWSSLEDRMMMADCRGKL